MFAVPTRFLMLWSIATCLAFASVTPIYTSKVAAFQTNIFDFRVGCGIVRTANLGSANADTNFAFCPFPKSVPMQNIKSRFRMCSSSESVSNVRRQRRVAVDGAKKNSEQPKLLNEFSAKAALLLAEAGGKMSASQFRRRWKFTFPDDSLDRSFRNLALGPRLLFVLN
jgi:hypothetical protein